MRPCLRTALRVFFRIVDAWRLDAAEAAVLLGVDLSTCRRWRSDVLEPWPSEGTVLRLAYIVDIYGTLQVLLRIPERADGWLRQPNSAANFEGRPALDRMLRGTVSDLRAVAEHLAAALSGDFS